MRLLTLYFLMLSLLGLSLSAGVSYGQSASHKWTTSLIDNTEYVSLDDLWKFYGFVRVFHVGREGYLSYGAKNRYVSLKENRQDFYVNNFRYILSYPIRVKDDKLMISAIDVRKLVDPVLRPQYSAQSEKVTTVIIDPGHGGKDAGAVSPYAREKDCNLELALRLRDRLVKKGLKVIMTRDGDYFLTLQQRVDIANKYPQSIFVSIHHNSARATASGIETFTLAPQGTTSPYARSRTQQSLQGNNQDSENIALATAVHSRAIQTSGAIDRGIQRARFSVLCTIKRPAILFEAGFVTHPNEGKLVSSEAYQNRLADAICNGILSYCSIVGGQGGLRRTNKRSGGSNSWSGNTYNSARTYSR